MNFKDKANEVEDLPGYYGDMPATSQCCFIYSGTIFKNWVDFKLGSTHHLYRSSQPYYENEEDEEQEFDNDAIKILKTNNIKCIVSMNSKAVRSDSQKKLKKQHIEWVHIPIEDFAAPRCEDFEKGCQVISKAMLEGFNVLVYCGFGVGRTGAMVAAYEILCALTRTPALTQPDNVVSDIIGKSTIERETQKAALNHFAQYILKGLYHP
ncbi:protein-tyrosine phosphatase family protein [Pseudomonas palleroniana]